MSRHLTSSVIVSCDISTEGDTAVLLVGKKKPGEVVEIINAFQGDEAIAIWKKLTTVNKGE